MTLVFTPKAGMIFVKPVESKPTTSPEGLIQLAESYDFSVPTTGIIVAMGPPAVCDECLQHTLPSELSEGDVVVWPPSCGDDLEIGEDTYVVLRESDIIATVWKEEGQQAV